ncbi:MAG: hypothetical protein WBQ13_14875 [Terriglobales bacterium]
MATPTSSTLNGDGKGQPRIQPGRAIPDSPASLATAAPARLPGSGDPLSDSVNSGMSVGSQLPAPIAKSVDARDVSADFNFGRASHPGDSRAPNTGAGVTDQFKTQGGPRTQQPGQQNSKFYREDGKGFQSTSNSPDSDAGN